MNGKVLSEKPMFLVKSFSKAYTDLATNEALRFTASDLKFSVPDGYRIFAISRISGGSGRIAVDGIDPYNSDRTIVIKNFYSSAVSATASIFVTFIREDFLYRAPLVLRGKATTSSEGSNPIVGYPVTVSINNPSEGDTMTITGVGSSTITTSDTSYTFIMPNNKVVVTAYDGQFIILD